MERCETNYHFSRRHKQQSRDGSFIYYHALARTFTASPLISFYNARQDAPILCCGSWHPVISHIAQMWRQNLHSYMAIHIITCFGLVIQIVHISYHRHHRTTLHFPAFIKVHLSGCPSNLTHLATQNNLHPHYKHYRICVRSHTKFSVTSMQLLLS